VIAILFFWTVRFINEVLSLATVVYRISDKTSSDINFESADSKTPPILYVFLIIGWFVLFARNFYVHKLITDPIRSFIQEKRTIGDFSFNIGSMLEFFLILFIAGLISNVVSFFASGRHNERSDNTRKGGIGSWLLLIRISIISIGLLLAFAAGRYSYGQANDHFKCIECWHRLWSSNAGQQPGEWYYHFVRKTR
jgi:hypothetical protein